jgi:hypothetical protein
VVGERARLLVAEHTFEHVDEAFAAQRQQAGDDFHDGGGQQAEQQEHENDPDDNRDEIEHDGFEF